MVKELVAVGGDIFAGSFTHGVKRAGFKVGIHLEHGDYGVATAKLNFPDLDVHVGVENWHPEKIKGVDFLYTNPPCAPWSTLSVGRALTWDKDPRLSCIDTLMEAGLSMKVKAFAWESVTQAWGKGRSFVDEKARMWMEKGYHVTILIQNNLFLGAPQSRKRMFFIAHKHPLIWPALVTKHKTVSQLIKGTKVTENEKLWLKPGDKILWEKAVTNKGKWSAVYRNMTDKQKEKIHCKPSFLSSRLFNDQICTVLFPGHTSHPDEPRRLAYQEMLALCGLPKTWQVDDYNFNYVSGILVRCVLSPVGTWLGRAVRDGLLEHPPLRGKPQYRLVTITTPTIKEEEITYAGGCL